MNKKITTNVSLYVLFIESNINYRKLVIHTILFIKPDIIRDSSLLFYQIYVLLLTYNIHYTIFVGWSNINCTRLIIIILSNLCTYITILTILIIRYSLIFFFFDIYYIVYIWPNISLWYIYCIIAIHIGWPNINRTRLIESDQSPLDLSSLEHSISRLERPQSRVLTYLLDASSLHSICLKRLWRL